MASRPKRKFVSTRDQERLVQEFYDGLDEDEEYFLGNQFAGEGDVDNDFDSSNNTENNSDNEIVHDSNELVENIFEVDEQIRDEEEEVELPRKQKFKNLDEVLDESNYADAPVQPNLTFEYSDARKTVNITWNTVRDANLHRRGAENIMNKQPGPRGAAKYVKTPIEAFQLFFSDDMINNIVLYTNAVIEPVIERFSDVFENSDKYPHFRVVDYIDIRAYLGTLYLRAAFRVNLLSTSTIWNHESSHDLFSATMSENRLKFISRFITFDDKSSRAERWKNDKFACMRELFELMNQHNAKWRYPSDFLAIDETLYPYRGAIGFKQYNPNKPSKYGLLYRSLCDSTTTYTYYTLPYAGKPEIVDGDGAKFYITGTDEYTKYLVNELSNYNSIQWCNISMDRYFTSVSLAEWALEKNLRSSEPCATLGKEFQRS